MVACLIFGGRSVSRARAVRLVVLTSLLALLMGSCSQPDDLQPTPTPVVVTPIENAQEREQRLAYEAAEKSYREFRAEYDRVLKSGGAKAPTFAMKKNAAGPYLKETSEVSQAFNGLGYHRVGLENIVFIRRNGYESGSLSLKTCEDSSNAKILNRDKKVVGRGEIRTIDLDVHLIGSTWKLWSGSGMKVDSCS